MELLWRGQLFKELTTNYCSTTVSGNNLFLLLRLLYNDNYNNYSLSTIKLITRSTSFD